mgnify:CR=1 FL=1|jgi:lysylphosphatidylglycerol synthetase-like protein (DUF2156 family)
MRFLWDLLLSTYALLSLVPFFIFILVWYVARWRTGDKKRATALAMDVTTFFLVGVVAGMLDTMRFRFGGIWLLILLFLLAIGLIGNAQYRLRKKLDVKRQLRAAWRLGFLGLSAAYLILLVVGIVRYFHSI